ncbi:MAG: FHIPEP family type III secretion protein [Polyangiales bacterium]
MAAFAAALVALLLAPVPPVVLDALLAANLGVALAVFVACLDGPPPALRARLPRVLLLGALARLALELAAVRLALSRGHAGAVIDAFGRAVLGGDWAVGAAVFVALTVVQLVVVVRGAERAAEVAARFDLDALPGRQMALDAELRAGRFGAAEGATERERLARESRFHAAMDGAMRFVKGDAYAGLVIVAVNLTVGASIGATRGGLSVGDAVSRYASLAVGQGMAAQVPSLLMSAAAALSVTRVVDAGDDAALSRAAGVAAAVVAVIALLPGFPTVPFALTALALAAPLVAARARALTLTAPRGEALQARALALAAWRDAGFSCRRPQCGWSRLARLARAARRRRVEVDDVSGLRRALPSLVAGAWTVDRAEAALRALGTSAPALHRVRREGVRAPVLAEAARSWRRASAAAVGRGAGELVSPRGKVDAEEPHRGCGGCWCRRGRGVFDDGVDAWQLSPDVAELLARSKGEVSRGLREELAADRGAAA